MNPKSPINTSPMRMTTIPMMRMMRDWYCTSQIPIPPATAFMMTKTMVKPRMKRSAPKVTRHFADLMPPFAELSPATPPT